MELFVWRARVHHETYVYVMYAFACFLRINSATISDNKYRVVMKTIEQNHAGSVTGTSSWNSKLGCASTCESSQCLSFSYNSLTHDCTTYGDEICYRDDGVTSSSLKFYTKIVNFGWHPTPSTGKGHVMSRRELTVEDEPLGDCGDVPTAHCSGVYTITPTPNTDVDVLCDMDTAGGPWTVVASRYDGSVDFYKTWNEYKNGFGSLTGEFWLGFERVRLLLTLNMQLRIEMEGWSSSQRIAEYSTFNVADEASKYRLTVGGYSSPDGLFDALADHSGRPFSTTDIDNDSLGGDECSDSAHGAWWYGACFDSNLFGTHSPVDEYTSMVWKYFYATGTSYTAVKTVRMMLIKKP